MVGTMSEARASGQPLREYDLKASTNGKRKADRARWRAADVVVVVEHVLDSDEYINAWDQRSPSYQIEHRRAAKKQGVEVVFVLRPRHSKLSQYQPYRVVVPHVESHVVICDLWRVIVSEAGVALESGVDGGGHRANTNRMREPETPF